MKRTFAKFRNSALLNFIRRHKKYGPILFFIGGFIFDTITLGRIDSLYALVVLSLYMIGLTLALFAFNLVDDEKWRDSLIEQYKEYFPSLIQFLFGGLSSAYVIYFSRSVSLSKTASFFIILLILFLANEILKKRISNKYLQFSLYSFISFTFFSFMMPVFVKEMNLRIFILSGVLSLISSLILIISIYRASPSTRAEIHLGKMTALVLLIYTAISLFYHFKLIPPVPMALEKGIVAHDVSLVDNRFVVTYEEEQSYVFWRHHRLEFIHNPDSHVYVFSAIFAPKYLKETIFHRWKWYDNSSKNWVIVEDIGYEITGGRERGFRGYTFKNNVIPGLWKVEVMTDEEMILGVIDFEIIISTKLHTKNLVKKVF